MLDGLYTVSSAPIWGGGPILPLYKPCASLFDAVMGAIENRGRIFIVYKGQSKYFDVEDYLRYPDKVDDLKQEIVEWMK
jgi:hypothetical protein